MAERRSQHPGWTKPSLHLRLSKERLANLLALAVALPEGCAPADAVDKAIEMALATLACASQPSEARFDDIDDAIAQLASQAIVEARRQHELAREVARDVKELRDLISAAAAAEYVDGNDIIHTIPTMRSWLDAEAGGEAQVSLLIKARGQGVGRRRDGVSDQVFEVEILANASSAIPPGTRTPTLVKLEHGLGQNLLNRVDPPDALYWACKKVGGGWHLDARLIEPGGGIGPSLGSQRI